MSFQVNVLFSYCLSSEVFHEYLCVATVAELGYTLLAYLAYTLTCKSESVAYFLESFLWSTDSETFADDCYLTVLQHLVEHVFKLLCH